MRLSHFGRFVQREYFGGEDASSIARKLDLEEATVRRILSGEEGSGPAVLRKISEASGVPLTQVEGAYRHYVEC